MTDTELIQKIESLAGDLRKASFVIAAKYALEHKFTIFVETGCYRGIDADGQSTIILALLALQNGGFFTSHDNNEVHCELARKMLTRNGFNPRMGNAIVSTMDSVTALRMAYDKVQFLYLDSYDYEEQNPGPCQRHQLAEVGAILAMMDTPSLILIDDCALPHGGKAGLSAPFLEERGWKMIYGAYQRIYVKE